jgi:acyl-CoA thioesterase
LTGEYAFDTDSRVELVARAGSARAGSARATSAGVAGSAGESDLEYRAVLTDRWNGIGNAANGGYMLATCMRALGLTMPFPDPIVMSGFFLRPGTAGPVAIRTSVAKRGKTTAFGAATMTQAGKEVVRATAAFATLGGQDGPVFLGGAPPDLPPPRDCVRIPAGALGRASIAARIDFRSAELPGWATGQPSGQPSSEFWMRFADGRDADIAAMPLLVDSTAPSVLELGVTSSTIELTVHLRARPAPGWLACRSSTRFVGGGYHEEDYEIWDSDGTLAAQSRQLALVLPL